MATIKDTGAFNAFIADLRYNTNDFGKRGINEALEVFNSEEDLSEAIRGIRLKIIDWEDVRGYLDKDDHVPYIIDAMRSIVNYLSTLLY